MQKGSILSIAVPNPLHISSKMAGAYSAFMFEGERVMALHAMYIPRHDRSLWEEVLLPFARWYKPTYIIVLGRAFDLISVQQLAPAKIREEDSVDDRDKLPEVVAAKEHSEIWENRVFHLMNAIGQYFVQLLEAADQNKKPNAEKARLFYIPAIEGPQQKMPPEAYLKLVFDRIQPRVDGWRKANKWTDEQMDGIPKLPRFETITEMHRDLKMLLGLTDHPRIHVLPFGSKLHIRMASGLRDQLLAPALQALLKGVSLDEGGVVLDRELTVRSVVNFEVGKRKLTNPVQVAYDLMVKRDMSTVLGSFGQLCNGWLTKLIGRNTPDRRYLHYSQIGHLWEAGLVRWGGGEKEHYAQGFYAGENQRGALHGKSHPIRRGKGPSELEPGRRGVMVYGKYFGETVAAGLGRSGSSESF
jgi:hypothetical protein